MTGTETPFVVRHWPERGVGAIHPIEGWVDGQSVAVITWRGTDSGRTYTREYTDHIEAANSVGSIERYVNLELVSAVIRPKKGGPAMSQIMPKVDVQDVIDALNFSGSKLRTARIDYTHQDAGVIELLTFQGAQRFSITIKEEEPRDPDD